MDPPNVERKLTTILCADVAGYGRLMGAREEATLHALKDCMRVIGSHVADHRGRIFASAGDSVMAEFPSAVGAVRCAVEIQDALAALAALGGGAAADRRMRFRIGINLGDVMVEGEDLLGEGVNVAARLQALAEEGRHMHFGRCLPPGAGKDRARVCRYGRARGQEHRRAGPRLSRPK